MYQLVSWISSINSMVSWSISRWVLCLEVHLFYSHFTVHHTSFFALSYLFHKPDKGVAGCLTYVGCPHPSGMAILILRLTGSFRSVDVNAPTRKSPKDAFLLNLLIITMCAVRWRLEHVVMPRNRIDFAAPGVVLF